MKALQVNIKKISFVIGISTCLFSCSKNNIASLSEEPKEDNTIITEWDTTIHVLGLEILNNRRYIKYWKNNELMASYDLEHPDLIFKLAVENDNVYIIGNEINYNNTIDRYKPYVIKNGYKHYLANDTKNIRAVGIAVHNGDTYICANELLDNGKYVALYWKNNESPIYLKDGNNETIAEGIKIINNSLYVLVNSTNSNGLTSIAYWKNNEMYKVTNNRTDWFGKDFVVHKDKVYIGGYGKLNTKSKYYSMYWVDNTPTTTSDGKSDAYGMKISVKNDIVSLLGLQQNNGQTIEALNLDMYHWKSGNEIKLTPLNFANIAGGPRGTILLDNLKLIDDDIYILGINIANQDKGIFHPTYWKNNNAIIMNNNIGIFGTTDIVITTKPKK